VLGILDSGLGGLTVLQSIRKVLPAEDIIYFADQHNSPLGTRPSAELARLFQCYVDRLQEMGVDGIAMGSNTLCAVARDHGWPAKSVPIIDMIEPTARTVAALGKKRVGVLATEATVKSGVYGDAIRDTLPGANVQEVAASELVGYVEQGIIEGAQVQGSLRAAFSKFPDEIDLLVLGCTHFPWLHRSIREVFTGEVELLDPADPVAREVVTSRAARHGGRQTSSGTTRFMTTGDAKSFERNIEKLLGPLHESDVVVQVEPVGVARRSQ
jgi:glutamate racemase